MKNILILKLSGIVYLLVLFNCLAFLRPPDIYSAEHVQTVKIGGVGSELGTIKELAMTFNKECPEANIVIVPNLGCEGGMEALIDGAIDISLSNKPLLPHEIKNGLTAVKYAKTPFVFVTAHETKNTNFTISDIAKIFSGETKNWPEGTPVRIILRPASDSDTIQMRGMSPEMDKAVQGALSRKGMLVAPTCQEAATAIEKINGSIGTSTLSMIITEQRHLNLLTLNGVMPSLETLSNGAYPYFKELYIVTGPKISYASSEFIEFIRSSEGREILTRTGHLNISE